MITVCCVVRGGVDRHDLGGGTSDRGEIRLSKGRSSKQTEGYQKAESVDVFKDWVKASRGGKYCRDTCGLLMQGHLSRVLLSLLNFMLLEASSRKTVWIPLLEPAILCTVYTTPVTTICV